MRVLIDAVAGGTGGASVRIQELASTLPSIGPEHDYLFVVPEPRAAIVSELAPQCEVLTPPRWAWSMPARVAWEHAELPIQTKGWGPDAAISPFNVIPTRWPGPRPKLAVIVSNLAPFSPELNTMYRGKEALRLKVLRRVSEHSIRAADKVFLLSKQGFSLISKSLLGEKAEIIPMAPPRIPTNLPTLPEGVRPPFFLVACDLMRFKGVEQVIDAFALLPSEPRPLLVICGSHVEREYVSFLENAVTRLGLTGTVAVHGSLKHSEVLSLMHNAVAVIAPSRFENASRVPVEAMALGAPVIASDIASFHEACGDAALYFPLDHPHILAAHAERVLHDRALRDRLRARAAKHIRSLTHTSAAAKLLACINQWSRETDQSTPKSWRHDPPS